jgi:flagellar basal-body rod protein FlgB
MSFADVPLFNLIQEKLSWLSNRQNVLARNIANASTPGYVPQDLAGLEFGAVLAAAARGELGTTNSRHLKSRSSVGGSYRAIAAPGSQSSPDGNSVVLEEQAMKMAETQLGYAEATGLYKKMISLWRSALGGHG